MGPNFREILPLLARNNVRFILIGGGAATAHGSARITYDVDVVCARDPENLRNLVAALQPHQPYLRGAPPGLPFRWDEPTIRAGLNFTLTTDLGDLDVLGEVAGGGTYEELLPFTQEVTAFGLTFRVVTLERLIQLKRAAGRPKDLDNDRRAASAARRAPAAGVSFLNAPRPGPRTSRAMLGVGRVAAAADRTGVEEKPCPRAPCAPPHSLPFSRVCSPGRRPPARPDARRPRKRRQLPPRRARSK